MGNMVTQTDALGRVTLNAFDALYRLVQTMPPDPDGPQGPQTSPVTTFAYDAAGNVVTQTDALGRSTQFRYDSLNRRVEMIDARGGASTSRYDAVGNLVSQTDALGRVTQHDYDALNRLVRTTKPDPDGGSTDVGDVSWIVPTLHLSVTTAPEGAPWHAWPVVACGGMSIGHKGMMYAAKALAATMVDLFEDQKAREEIQKEFKEKSKGEVYKPYVPDGPPPIPRD